MGENAAVVEAAYEAFGRGDIGAVLGLLADDVEWSVPLTVPHGGTFKGVDGVQSLFEGLGGQWDGLSLDVEAVADVGPDKAVGIVRASGTRKGGGAASYGTAMVFTIRDGKIARFRELVDLDAAMEA